MVLDENVFGYLHCKKHNNQKISKTEVMKLIMKRKLKYLEPSGDQAPKASLDYCIWRPTHFLN